MKIVSINAERGFPEHHCQQAEILFRKAAAGEPSGVD
jgi:hypothetical protein